MALSRRDLFRWTAAGSAGLLAAATRSEETAHAGGSESAAQSTEPLTITEMTVTPIALPDPPILAASGCHGPYFLRNIIQIQTDAGIVGIGETKGGSRRLNALNRAKEQVLGKNAFAYRRFAETIGKNDSAAYAGIELACLDACGKATGRRVCELLGGPVRKEVEFAAYLFYRFAADHPVLMRDSRLVDDRGRGDNALDDWGEVRTADSMATMAQRFQKKWGFRVFKLKAGVLPPEIELATMFEMNDRFGGKLPLRIDPNARWTVNTAVRIGRELKDLPIDYYEDPVGGQNAMADVRAATGLVMSTNMCVTRFSHIPSAVKVKPVDVVLGDHHGWGGVPALQELGRICETFGWGLSQHSNNHAGITMAAMIHVGAIVPQLNYASDTHYVWLVEGEDIIEGPNLPIKNGKMTIPSGVGLGVRIDQDRLARAHERWKKSGMRDRDDATTMRMIEPSWKRTLF